MSPRPLPEDLDADPVSIVLDHLDFACRAAGAADLVAPLPQRLERGEARLHFVIRGKMEWRPERDGCPIGGPDSRRLDAGEGLIVTGPAAYSLRSLPAGDTPCGDSGMNSAGYAACEQLTGEVVYSAMEFPPETRFLPAVWGGALTGERCRDLLPELERRSRSPQDPSWHLVGQYVALELGRAHLRGDAATPEWPGTPLAALVRDPQLGPLVGLLIRTVAHGWDAEDLARPLEVGRRAFAGRLRELSDLSPFELLTVLRMQRASRHLATPGISLKQVPKLVGYRSLSALSAAFSRVGGLTLAESRTLGRGSLPAEHREG